MPLPTATATDYLWQFQRLLPRGRVWQRGWGTLQAAHLLTLMPTWARLHARAGEVIGETFPCTVAGEMLPEWEATLGLPDCEALGTIQQRQAAVCAKFTALGGQSIPYFIDLAERLGFVITIETFRPFRAGVNRAGERLYGAGWAFVWRVHAPETTVIWFRAGVSAAGEPLATWGNELLECTFNALKPAHTVVIFAYGGGT